MPELGNLQSVVDAAEQAAGAGDFGAAAKLLQQAVQLQETELGPKHPDLANTLNNLGVVCERIGDWPEAERSYRRAAAIAAASLPPEHPFVATSRQNLSDFCALRGLPLDPASAASGSPSANGPAADFTTERQPFADAAPRPSTTPASARPAPAPAKVTPAVPASRATAPPAIARPPVREPERPSASSRGLAIAALVAIGAIVALIAIRPWSRSPEDGTTSVAPPPASTGQPVAAPPPAVPPPAAAPPAVRSGPPAPPASKPDPNQKPAAVTVVTAQLCRTLGTGGAEWTCTPAGAEVTAGPLYFYTRLKSPADVVVRHRWYRGDQLRQAGDLKISANSTAGYRTYSRHTVAGGPATWRVELRTLDGRLLHEERFVVR
jgi:Tetratricopeptide repeat/Protein of unknown function (DUF2914)